MKNSDFYLGVFFFFIDFYPWIFIDQYLWLRAESPHNLNVLVEFYHNWRGSISFEILIISLSSDLDLWAHHIHIQDHSSKLGCVTQATSLDLYFGIL